MLRMLNSPFRLDNCVLSRASVETFSAFCVQVPASCSTGTFLQAFSTEPI